MDAWQDDVGGAELDRDVLRAAVALADRVESVRSAGGAGSTRDPRSTLGQHAPMGSPGSW